ncbi:MAG TPA: 16S rRNA (guanine(527)-N(7))-methyltransferase RsmG [Turneriella sp.]|nr:16S rRNA (guanine(527)-N(7))-methyltransferase RsmG [Turneriella sp.]
MPKNILFSLLREIPQVTDEKVAMLLTHWQMMVASDDRTDLTRLERTRDIAIKHYLDSALPLKFIKLPSPLLDIGTGAGFPGLVLKILSPETHVILGEVRPKRVAFLKSVIDALELTGVQVYPHRIGPQFPLEVQGVVTRALESARDTLYRVATFLPQGGQVILLKGPKGAEEISEALAALPNFKHEKTYRYRLANTSHARQLVVFTRVKESIRTKNVEKFSPVENSATNKGIPQSLEITSRANNIFKLVASLNESRTIKREERFIVSGKKIIDDLLRNPNAIPFAETLILGQRMHVENSTLKRIYLADALFREVDTLGTKQPLLLMRTPPLQAWQGDSVDGITVFLPFQDPANIGAAIRSAVAFGAQRVVLLKEAASPFLPKAVRACAGSIFNTTILEGPSISELVENPIVLLALDMEGIPIDKVPTTKSVSLLVGVEGYGYKNTGNTTRITIPISKNIESLNAQSALAIALYELSRRMV